MNLTAPQHTHAERIAPLMVSRPPPPPLLKTSSRAAEDESASRLQNRSQRAAGTLFMRSHWTQLNAACEWSSLLSSSGPPPHPIALPPLFISCSSTSPQRVNLDTRGKTWRRRLAFSATRCRSKWRQRRGRHMTPTQTARKWTLMTSVIQAQPPVIHPSRIGTLFWQTKKKTLGFWRKTAATVSKRDSVLAAGSERKAAGSAKWSGCLISSSPVGRTRCDRRDTSTPLLHAILRNSSTSKNSAG